MAPAEYLRAYRRSQSGTSIRDFIGISCRERLINDGHRSPVTACCHKSGDFRRTCGNRHESSHDEQQRLVLLLLWHQPPR